MAEDISEVMKHSTVVWWCREIWIRLDPLLTILDSCVLFGDEPQVKEEEEGDDKTERGGQQVGRDQVVGKLWVYRVVGKEGREERPGSED